jgi:hypothetical protein
MWILELIKKIFEKLPSILDYTVLLCTLGVAAFGTIRAYLEVPDFLKDLSDKFRDKDYRVKSSILKVLIAEDRTQMIKLRNVRVHKKVDKLVLDQVPRFGPGPVNEDQPAHLQPPYSVPGRTSVVPMHEVNMFQIDFLPDESKHLSEHHDHPILLSYFLAEKLDTLFNPPGVIAIQPVGTERLTIEVYFPPTRRLKEGTAKVRVMDDKGIPGKDLEDSKAQVRWYHYDFHDGLKDIDYIRAVINKPPQKCDIEFYWDWELKSTPPTY